MPYKIITFSTLLALLLLVFAGLRLAQPNPSLATSQVTEGARLGHSLATTIVNDTLFVLAGAPNDNPGQRAGQDSAGSAILFRYDPTLSTLVEVEKLAASDTSAADKFGFAVDIHGQQVIIGAPNNSSSGDKAGAAYFFDLAVSNAPLKLQVDPNPGDVFGHAVAINDEFIAIGLPNAEVGGVFNAGKVTLFRIHSPDSVSLVDTLQPDPPMAGQNFGWSLALADSANVLVVGAPKSGPTGAVYIFSIVPGESNWVQREHFSPGEPDGAGFGWSVSVSGVGSTVLAGLPEHPDRLAALVFEQDGNQWPLRNSLVVPEDRNGDRRGRALALTPEGDFAVVGTPLGSNGQGRLFQFRRRGSEWSLGREVITDESPGDATELGFSVAIRDTGRLTIAGAPGSPPGGSLALLKAPPPDCITPPALKLTFDCPNPVLNLDQFCSDSTRFFFADSSADSLSYRVAGGGTTANATLRSRNLLEVMVNDNQPADASESFLVTATSALGLQTTFSLAAEVNLRPDLIPPARTPPLPDTTINVEDTLRIALNSIFFDPDSGDLLKYDSDIVDPEIATDTVLPGGLLQIIPSQAGATSILVNVSDGIACDTLSTSFRLTVLDSTNSSPSCLSFADTLLTVGCPGLLLNLNEFCRDPENGRLRYTASSSDTGVATAVIQDAELTVSLSRPDVADNAVITIIAIDSLGVASPPSAFTIAVNYPPAVRMDTPDTTLFSGDIWEIDLNQVFTDPDRDPLIFEITDFDPNIASARLLQDSLLQITALAAGQAEITVSASDRLACIAASDSFGVTIIPAEERLQINHQPIEATGASPVTISAGVSPDSIIASVRLFYRRGGDRTFVNKPMQPVGGQFEATIPLDSVTARGLEYIIQATDVRGLSNRRPAGDSLFYSIRVSVDNQVSTIGTSGNNSTSYRLVSAPMQLNDRAVTTLLSDLGDYNRENWRFFGLKANYRALPESESIYSEYPTTSAMIAGSSYWLLVNSAGKEIRTGPGASERTDRDFDTLLNPGWNLVGNPFAFSLPIGSLQIGGIPLPSGYAMRYEAAWQQADSLRPFQGLAVFNDENANRTLSIRPYLAVDAQEATASPPVREDIAWSIGIHASTRFQRDTENFLLVSTDAVNEWDRMDWPEPLVIGDFVSVYFPHPEWGRVTSRFSRDARAPSSAGYSWDLAIESSQSDVVELDFSGIHTVPPNMEVWLIDELLNLSVNLREKPIYSLAVKGRGLARRLKLVVGSPDQIDENNPPSAEIPGDFVLAQNFPNPFNPATTISYSLPVARSVTLRIYNLKGESVRTLVNAETRSPGRHFAAWDGRDQQGRQVASGVYIYKLQAGSFTALKKMILVK